MDQSRTNKVKWLALAIGVLLVLVIAWPRMGRVPPEALGVGPMGLRHRSGSTVAFLTVTNLSDKPILVEIAADSKRTPGGWAVGVSAQYPPLAAHTNRIVKIGFDDSGDAWRVRISSAPAPGELRNACLTFCIRYKLTFAIRLLAPRFLENAVINVPTGYDGSVARP